MLQTLAEGVIGHGGRQEAHVQRLRAPPTEQRVDVFRTVDGPAGRCNVAPTHNAGHTSHAIASKPKPAHAGGARPPACRLKAWQCQSTKLQTLRCSTITPLGKPAGARRCRSRRVRFDGLTGNAAGSDPPAASVGRTDHWQRRGQAGDAVNRAGRAPPPARAVLQQIAQALSGMGLGSTGT